MKVIRVREGNGAAALRAIPGAYVTATPRQMAGGCGDPGCCPQHPGVIDGEPAVGVALPAGMSGRAAHRALVAAGIVKG
jgi:hypothetical protein